MSGFFPAGAFDEFNNCTVSIFAEGGSTKNDRGIMVPAAAVAILSNVLAQEWELDANDKAGFTGEEILLMKKVRLGQYYPNLTAKMWAVVDGVKHNIINPGHDGSKSFTILLLRKTSQ